jgi:purine-binding chemotaxis protein CheW
MAELYLIAYIDGCRIAINSGRIESIVQIPEIIFVPRTDPSIAGLFALRSRVLTLIDSQYFVTGNRQQLAKGCLAVVVEISGHHYGLAVDKVEDVVSISYEVIQKSISPSSKWKPIVSDIAQVDDHLVMILDPAKMVQCDQLLAA